MNSKLVAFLLAIGLAPNTQAVSSFFFNTGNAAIPDNDSNGYHDSRTVGGMSGVISDVNVTLNISGGFNGDLYAWLSHGSGLAVLLNRVGRFSTNTLGYGNTGFGLDTLQDRFTLDDQQGQDVHFYKNVPYTLNGLGQLTGTWQPDGRIIDPDSARTMFDTAPRSNLLGVFDGLDPNGQWTLFVADQNSGDISTLTEWGLQITMVPEPSTLALAGLGAAALAIFHRRR